MTAAATKASPTTSGFALSRGITLLFAVAGGTAVANVYFAQPLLVTLGQDFSIGTATVGAVVTLLRSAMGWDCSSSCRWAICSTAGASSWRNFSC